MTDAERSRYGWQLDIAGFGEAGQERLRQATVLVSRIGGLGGQVAYQLAAAGVGHLVIAHGGTIREDDLNRQLLMTHAGIGQLRVAVAAKRLAELNPFVRITPLPENLGEANAERLLDGVDLVVDCAPLFAERFAMNRAALRLGKPMIECAVYELQGQVTCLVPGRSPCLACLYPEAPLAWKRRFPIFGAVAATVGGLAALEAIKLLTGLGNPLIGRMLVLDLRTVHFQVVELQRRQDCPVCGPS